uniref:Uncharacterized protein n=1 Tax=Dulem virus 40 TaxID=3145758 RepID=A0AAU8AVN0_9CAUD
MKRQETLTVSQKAHPFLGFRRALRVQKHVY